MLGALYDDGSVFLKWRMLMLCVQQVVVVVVSTGRTYVRPGVGEHATSFEM